MVSAVENVEPDSSLVRGHIFLTDPLEYVQNSE